MSVKVKNERHVSAWGFILIGIGVIWLLGTFGILNAANFSVLFRLWPLILIVIGVNLLIGYRSNHATIWIGLGTVALVIVLMVVGPGLGLSYNTTVEAAEFSEPLGDAEAAQVELDIAVGSLQIQPLRDSSRLFEADIHYTGTYTYDVSDEPTRLIRLHNQTENGLFGLFSWIAGEELRWDVGLNPAVPLDLTVSGGTASATLDLSTFDLTGLDIDVGTGSVNAQLPAAAQTYDATISTGTGSADIVVADGARLNLEIKTGTGSVDIDVPDDASVRLEAETGTGSVSVPSWMRRIDGDEDGVGDDGTWETAGFANASDNARITIQFDGGTGSFNLR